MVMDLMLIAAGIVLLASGGELLIRGALTLAQRLGISPLLSGLVVVGFGTSAPELVVSLDAALSSRPDIAVGNVIGSNIGNILLILGVSATILPLVYQPMALRRDAVAMLVATVAVMLLAAGGTLGAVQGAVMLTGLAGYLIWAYTTEKGSQLPAGELHAAESAEMTPLPVGPGLTLVMLAVGLGLLIGGSRVLLTGASSIAAELGLSEALIGLTLVAVGTSLPELTVSVMAAIRRHADVAIGNILGSNIFNILGILGVSALVQPLPLASRMAWFDQWIMLGAAVLLTLFLVSGRRLSRLEGVVLLMGYGAYVAVGVTL
ncbi:MULTISPECIES: calcium/sodium antiporter [Halomonadaceae]|uniref:Calcium/sodium antiporter n=2 Tax=Vreelandella halophila TaxID=86177 RepID=A0A9X4YAR8_9GAMM|nr:MULTISPECIES: calcium/sodium antiporter [Halomonas]MYL25628.1 calcium/sodium antiporter [Halomonas utahensis]MYL74864.1 calcium/sodium antiporter [Halomonas sp. 22501_18_FS]